MLELNATLHARYVEESTVGVRELLKRLTEEVGRLEGMVRQFSECRTRGANELRRFQGKAQAQMYQRSLLEMEKHRRRLELEHGELMSRVQYLAEEVRCFLSSDNLAQSASDYDGKTTRHRPIMYHGRRPGVHGSDAWISGRQRESLSVTPIVKGKQGDEPQW